MVDLKSSNQRLQAGTCRHSHDWWPPGGARPRCCPWCAPAWWQPGQVRCTQDVLRCYAGKKWTSQSSVPSFWCSSCLLPSPNGHRFNALLQGESQVCVLPCSAAVSCW